MPYYTYKAKNLKGEVSKGVIFTENERAFYKEMKDQNLFCIAKEEKEYSPKRRFKKIKLKELVILSRQFSAMLGAGVSIIKCLDILQNQANKAYIKQIFGDIYEEVQKGNALSTVLRAQGNTFPELFVNMIELGEESGTLDQTFKKLEVHYEKESKLQDKVKMAMIYPIILGVVSSVVLIILMFFVIPSFFSMFEDMLDILPWNTKLLLNTSYYINSYWKEVLISSILGILVISAVIQSSYLKPYLDYIKLNLPIVGKLQRIILSARFAQVISTLHSSGLSLIKGIELAEGIVKNSYLEDGFNNLKNDVARGVPLSSALKKLEVFPVMLSQMILVGEESGQLDEVLNQTARFYEQEAEVAVQKLVSLLEPIMIIVLGIIIGFVVASILPPMYEIYKNIS